MTAGALVGRCVSLLRTTAAPRRPSTTRRVLAALASTALLAPVAGVALAAPASAHGGKDRIARLAGAGSASAGLIMSENIEQVGENPSQVAISGCFMDTAPVFVTSGVDSVRRAASSFLTLNSGSACSII